MPEFICPRCEKSQRGTPRLQDTSGCTRCSFCGVGLRWNSSFLTREISVYETFIPSGGSISPKTGNILIPEYGVKSPRILLKLLSLFFFPPARETLRKRREREGTLIEDGPYL